MLKTLVLAAGVSASISAAPAPFRGLPLVFEAGPGGEFRVHGAGHFVVLRHGEADLAEGTAEARLRFRGRNPRPHAEAIGALPGRVNYLTGNDPSRWRTGVRTSSRVRYHEVYPGVDVEYYGHGGRIEFDLVVAPGADPGVIRLEVEGAVLRIDRAGDLVTRDGTLRLRRPVVYQEARGGRREVRARYVLQAGNRAGFRLERWDRSRPLVIDPVLVFSTFLGGSRDEVAPGSTSDASTARIALDADGNIYVAGNTNSPDFPATAAFQKTLGGNVDAFVAKLDPSGAKLLYCTYFGGSGVDRAFALAVDSRGQAYFGGRTQSNDLPVTAGAFQRILRGQENGFIAKLSADGGSLGYATYLGGSVRDGVWALAVDAAGYAWAAGETSSPDFPVVRAAQARLSGSWDGFVSKLNSDGAALAWSTLLGGSRDDTLFGLALDAAGNAWVAGYTGSADFPAVKPVQPAFGGGQYDVAVAKLDSAGTVVFASALGGSGNDFASAVAVDWAGNAYLTGLTTSRDFPVTKNARQAVFGGGTQDALLVQLQAAGPAVAYASYIGGTGAETGWGIAVGPYLFGGLVSVAGATGSPEFPQYAGAVQPAYGGGTQDGFLAQFQPPDFTMVHFTYLGGTGLDIAMGVAVDLAGIVHVVGQTASTNFPVTAGAAQAKFGGGQSDAFVAKISTLANLFPVAQAYPSASASRMTGFAPEVMVSLFGEKLSDTTEASAAPATVVAGRTVTVRDGAGQQRQGQLLFVSPGQINFLIPAGTAVGLATIYVARQNPGTNTYATFAWCLVEVASVAPALFAANANGKGAASAIAVRTMPDGAQPWQYTFRCGAAPGSCVTAPVDLAAGGTVVLQLYGSGIRGRSGLAAVTARIGGVDAPVQYAGAQGSFPGLDQVNVIVPQSLAGRGEVDVVLTVDAQPANTVKVAFQ